MFKGKILVGRDNEIEKLRECLKDVFNGEGRMVFIAAEPGGGKTELVKEFLSRNTNGCFIAKVNCEPHKKEWGAYNEFEEVINKLPANFYKNLSPFVYKSLNATKNSASALANLVPIVGSPIASGITLFNNFRKEFKESPKEVNKNDIYQIHLSLISPLRSFVNDQKQAIIIFLDDLHLASNSSLQLIVSLGNELKTKSFRLLFIGTYRPQEVIEEPGHLLPGTIDTLKSFCDHQSDQVDKFLQEITLKSFEIPDINLVLSKLFPINSFPNDFANKIYDITHGNPMFVENFIKCLHDQKIILKTPKDNYELLDKQLTEIPLTLNESIAKRLSKLDKEFRGILNYASVLGTRFELNMLEKISSTDKIHLVEKLHELEVDFNLVSPNEQINLENFIFRYYSFTHILIRKYAYDMLAPELRSVYHQQAAEIIKYFYGDDLENNPEQNEEYKNHIRASKGLLNGLTLKLTDSADLPDTKETYNEWADMVDSEIQKADDFFSRNLTADAISSLKKAESILNEAGTKLEQYDHFRFSVHLYKTLLYRKSGLFYFAFKEAAVMIEFAQKTVDHVEQSKGFLAYYQALRAINRFQEADEYLKKVNQLYETQPPDNNNIFFFNTLGSFFNKIGYYNFAIELYQLGLSYAEKSEKDDPVATYYNNMGVSYANLNQSIKAIECYQKAIENCLKLKDQNSLLIYFRNLSSSYINSKKFSEALEVRKLILNEIIATGKKEAIARGYADIGYAYYQLKNFKDSENAYVEALKLFEEIEDKDAIKVIKECIEVLSEQAKN